MLPVETPARDALNAWIAKDPERRTLAAIGRALDVSYVAVSGWTSGRSRPEAPHMRAALEVLTEGDVRAADWDLPEELEKLAAVQPFRSTGT